MTSETKEFPDKKQSNTQCLPAYSSPFTYFSSLLLELAALFL